MKIKSLFGTLALAAGAVTLQAQTVDTVTTNGLFEPYGVTADLVSGFYYLTDSANNRVVTYDPATAEQASLADNQLFSPQGIVLARGGLVVAEAGAHALTKVAFDGTVTPLAGGTRGAADGPALTAQFNSPAGLATDAAGNIFIADTKNNAIRLLATDDTVSTYATGFYEPAGVAVDPSGRVFVADTRHHVIKVIAATPDHTVSVVAGQAGISGSDDGVGGGALFNAPRGLVWVGGETGLLVADSGNNTIRRVRIKSGTTGTVDTYTGSAGAPGFVNGTLSASRFSSPVGLVRDAQGSVLVADLYNNALRRIVRVTPALPVVTPVGGSYSNSVNVIATSTATNTTLRYTTDGTDPNAVSAALPNPLPLTVGGPVALKVRGFSPDFATSAVVSNNYAFFVNPLAVSVAGGSFANDVNVAVATATVGAAIRYTTDGSVPTAASPLWTDRSWGQTGPLVLRAFRDGFDSTPVVSNYFTFTVAQPVIEPAGISTNDAVTVTLSTDTTGAKLYYTIDGTKPSAVNGTLYTAPFLLAQNGTLKVAGFKAGYVDSAVTSAEFKLTVSDPVLAPVGASANNDLLVTLTNLSPGATIYWTIDGSDPTPASNLYNVNTGVKLGTSGTFKARGYRAGFVPSQIVSGVFGFTVANPVIIPAGRNDSNPVSVTITNATIGSQTYWTIDGSDPTPASTLYTAPFTLGTNGALRVISIKSGYASSGISSAVFNLVAGAPVITPGGASTNNVVKVTIDTDTVGANVRWTLGTGKLTPTTGIPYTGAFDLGTNGTLRVRVFKDGLVDSQESSAVFNLTVATPTIKPIGATSNNAVDVALGTATAGADIYWTIDGTEPAPDNGTKYLAQFPLGTNGTLRVKAFKNGFVDSAVASGGFNLAVATPVITPAAGTYINTLQVGVSDATSPVDLHYTLDGSTPTLASPIFGAGQMTLTTNATLSVRGSRGGFLDSGIVTADYKVQVDTPKLSPASGFFPNGTVVSISVLRADAVIYYTLDGQDPTVNDQRYTGPFVLNQISTPGSDVRAIKARAFAPGTLPSDIASGQPVPADAIGVPRDIIAGIGSTVVVPVVINLQTNHSLRSLQFRVQLTPTAAAVPNLASELRALNISGNDFVPVVGPAETGVATFNASSYRDLGAGGVATDGLIISAIGTNANFAVHDFATAALLAVPIPPTAKVGDTYKIEIVAPSGTSDGQQGAVTLTPLASRTITIQNVAYLVGDSSPGVWYNAGDFGSGDLDNSDVNNAFYASLGVHVPYSFTDAFDAMDAFPEDVNGSVGGDGQIRFLDWQRILRRSLRRDTNNWTRSWATGGVRVAARAALPAATVSPLFPQGLAGQMWNPEARLAGISQGDAQPGTVVKVPVFVNLRAGKTLSGLQFRAVVQPQAGAPAVEQPAQFVAAAGLPAPLSVGDLPAPEVSAAWSSLLNPLGAALGGSNQLGHVTFVVPASAQPGQCYTVNFVGADGAPDLNTQYDFDTRAACVVVQAPAPTTSGVDQPVPGFKLHWYAAPGTRYVLESTTELLGGQWKLEAGNLTGLGKVQEYLDAGTGGAAKFYRVRTLP